VSADLGCGLDYAPAVSGTHNAIVTAVCGFWRYISAMRLPFLFCLLA